MEIKCYWIIILPLFIYLRLFSVYKIEKNLLARKPPDFIIMLFWRWLQEKQGIFHGENGHKNNVNNVSQSWTTKKKMHDIQDIVKDLTY